MILSVLGARRDNNSHPYCIRTPSFENRSELTNLEAPLESGSGPFRSIEILRKISLVDLESRRGRQNICSACKARSACTEGQRYSAPTIAVLVERIRVSARAPDLISWIKIVLMSRTTSPLTTTARTCFKDSWKPWQALRLFKT